MKLPTTIQFADKDIEKSLILLKGGDGADQDLFKAILSVFDKLQQDAFSGIQIKKRLIPREYIEKWAIDNLWKYNLPQGWRLLYSVGKEGVVVVALILEWLPHKEYERRFRV